MVGCDSCDNWYHPACLGTQKTSEESFYCRGCLKWDSIKRSKYLAAPTSDSYFKSPDSQETLKSLLFSEILDPEFMQLKERVSVGEYVVVALLVQHKISLLGKYLAGQPGSH